MTVDYLTKAGPQPAFPLAVTVIDDTVCEAAYLLHEGGYQHYTAPHIDPAPWYDPGMGSDPTLNDSAQFLGVIISKVDGLDSTATRAITDRAVSVGGGSFGPAKTGHREMKFTATMYASTCRGMDYGMSWLTNTLRGRACSGNKLCTLEIWTGCPDTTSVGIDPQDSRWQFHDTALMSGPTYTGGPMETNYCHIREVEWSIGSQQAWKYKCPTDLVSTSLLSAIPSGCISISQWLTTDRRLALTATPASTIGENLLKVELTAGNRPLNCDIYAWTSPFVKSNCRGFYAPPMKSDVNYITGGNDKSWAYEVQGDGSWLRYDLNDSGEYASFPVSGSGTIRGVASVGDIDDTQIFRDIRIVAPSVSPATYSSRFVQGLIHAEAFRNCTIIGADLNVSYAVDGSTSSGSYRGVRHCGIRLSNFTGTAHIEGTHISGSTLYGGITVGSKHKGAALQLRNVLIEDVLSEPSDGGNGVYVNDGLYDLSIDGLSIVRTANRGLYVRPTDLGDGGTGLIQQATVKRFNASANVSSGSSRVLFFFGAQAEGSRRTPVRLIDCWISYPTGVSVAMAATSSGVIPWEQGLDASFRPYIEWPESASISGRIYRLDNPEGDFVDESTSGFGYIDLDHIVDDPCATYIVRGLPKGYRLVIDSNSQQVYAVNKAGVQLDGSAYVQTADGRGFDWLIFDCDPMCVVIDQPNALSGDGALVKVTQTYRVI